MKKKHNKKRTKHRHITDKEAETLARIIPNVEGACYMCFRVFKSGDQVTMTDLKGVEGLGIVSFCTPCMHELLSGLTIDIPMLGEPLRDEHHKPE